MAPVKPQILKFQAEKFCHVGYKLVTAALFMSVCLMSQVFRTW
jgi:hypothetical protein